VRAWSAYIVVLVTLAAACGGAQAPPSPTSTASEPAPSASAAPTPEPLTDAEVLGLTGDSAGPVDESAPAPVIDALAAEVIVRRHFTGNRQLIGIRRVTQTIRTRKTTGWLVALTPAVGQACSLNSGFLPRPIEGQIVNDQDGDPFWIFGCPESLP
jgi:hypothetical protein